MLDVILNLGLILAHCIDVIPTAPKLSIAVFELQIPKLFIVHEATLTLQIAHKTRHTHLGGNLKQHVDVVWATFCLHYFYILPFAQLAQNFANGALLFTIEHLAAIFRRKNNVIFAVHLVWAKLLASPIVTSF